MVHAGISLGKPTPPLNSKEKIPNSIPVTSNENKEQNDEEINIIEAEPEIVDISDDMENNQQQDSIIWEMMNSILKGILNKVVKEDVEDLDQANNDDEQITMGKICKIDFPKLSSSEKNEPEIVEHVNLIEEDDHGIVMLSSGDESSSSGTSGSGNEKIVTKANEEQSTNVILVEEKNNLVEKIEKADIFGKLISDKKTIEYRSKEIVSGILDDIVDHTFTEANTPSIVVDQIINMILEETICTSFTENDIKDMVIWEGKILNLNRVLKKTRETNKDCFFVFF